MKASWQTLLAYGQATGHGDLMDLAFAQEYADRQDEAWFARKPKPVRKTDVLKRFAAMVADRQSQARQ